MNASMLPPPKPRPKTASGIPPSELKYKKPEWSGKGPRGWGRFEVVKGGSLLDILKIEKEYHIIGRDPRCDTVIEHPSSSRQHAVFQLDNNDAVHVYDCDSAHGTFVNKRQIKPNTHVKLTSGDRVVFGNSTRTFILDLPREPEPEPEPQKPKQQQFTSEQQLFNSSKDSIKDMLLSTNSNSDSKPENQRTDAVTKDDRLEDVIGFDEEDEFYDRTVANKKPKKSKKVTAATLKKESRKIQRELDDLQCERSKVLISIEESDQQQSDDPHEQYVIQASVDMYRSQLKNIDARIKTATAELQKCDSTLKSVLPVLPELRNEEKRKATHGEMQIIKMPKKEPKSSKQSLDEQLKLKEAERQQRREERRSREQSTLDVLESIKSDMMSKRQQEPVITPPTVTNSTKIPTSETTTNDNNDVSGADNLQSSTDQTTDNDSWSQPKGQTGDGRCALNDLLGY
eukprot:TRINITY_DN6394_c0_g1_i1.p1 TRINITY_DN6394_c0_g1~~TRINITY_DN6394_c0_g1_i1.p1  ORF type:complete len:456 (+),score=105.45 TRINITY_DN6394_c0_g1_i1:943-2310(+)